MDPKHSIINGLHWKNINKVLLLTFISLDNKTPIYIRASDFFHDWWAEVTHGVKNGGSFSEMMGPSISN